MAHQYFAPGQIQTFMLALDLKPTPLPHDSPILTDHALFLPAQGLGQVRRRPTMRVGRAARADRELFVERGQKLLAQKAVGRFQIAYPSQAQFLDQPVLQ